jgi:hypothetical protein
LILLRWILISLRQALIVLRWARVSLRPAWILPNPKPVGQGSRIEQLQLTVSAL